MERTHISAWTHFYSGGICIYAVAKTLFWEFDHSYLEWLYRRGIFFGGGAYSRHHVSM